MKAFSVGSLLDLATEYDIIQSAAPGSAITAARSPRAATPPRKLSTNPELYAEIEELFPFLYCHFRAAPFPGAARFFSPETEAQKNLSDGNFSLVRHEKNPLV